MPHCEVEEISELPKFHDLKQDWNDLLSRSDLDLPFLRHEWLACWWEHFGGSSRLAVIVARQEGRLVFAAPLMEVRQRFLGLGFVILRSLTNHHSYRHGFLVERDEPEGARAFWRYLDSRARPWDLLQIEEMPQDARGHEIVQSAVPSRLRSELTTVTSSPFIPIGCEWEEFSRGLKTKFRSNMRNRTKRLAKEGVVSYDTVTGEEGSGQALTAGFEIEKRSWKGETGTAIAGSPLLTSFYTRWAGIAAREQWLQLSFLRLDGTPVAFDYSLKYGGRMFCMKIGYDPAYSRFSVGQLLTGQLLERCFKDGLVEYDFLGDPSVQKADWSSRQRSLVWLFVYSGTWKSRIHHRYKFGLKRKVKRFVDRWRSARQARGGATKG